jgi:hypothetical protein
MEVIGAGIGDCPQYSNKITLSAGRTRTTVPGDRPPWLAPWVDVKRPLTTHASPELAMSRPEYDERDPKNASVQGGVDLSWTWTFARKLLY